MHGFERRRLDVVVEHDGYRGAQMQNKRGRNRRLLEQALAKDGADAYLRYQLGKDFEVDGEFERAVPHYELARLGAGPHAAWRHDLALRLICCLKKTRNFERALDVAQQEMPLWPHSADFHFVLGDLLLDWAAAEPERGAQLLPMIEESWLTCLQLGDTLELEGAVAGRGSFLAAHNLAALHEVLGNTQQAAHYARFAGRL